MTGETKTTTPPTPVPIPTETTKAAARAKERKQKTKSRTTTTTVTTTPTKERRMQKLAENRTMKQRKQGTIPETTARNARIKHSLPSKTPGYWR